MDVNIIDFTQEHTKVFADLNYEWIGHFFTIEKIDRKYLDNPQSLIIDKGGAILLVDHENEIIGTIALINKGSNQMELAKMSVHQNHRGKKIGHQLMIASIEKAKIMNAEKIVILSNRKLENAIHLYEKFGFVDVGVPETDYERCDIRMELIL